MLGEWSEFRKWEEKEHELLREDLSEIKDKVDSLRLWRALILGMASVAGGIGGLLARFIS